MSGREMDNEMEDLVHRFTKGTKYALQVTNYGKFMDLFSERERKRTFCNGTSHVEKLKKVEA